MTHTDSPFVSIVFPNYNGGEFVLKAVRSCLESDYPEDRLEVVVVDNGSSDGSPEAIRKEFSREIDAGRVVVVDMGRNAGAPAAYNAGIRRAREGSRFIFKMDNDIILEKDCVAELVKPFADDPMLGATGGKVYYFADRNRIHLIGTRIAPWYAGGIGIGKFVLDEGQFDKPLAVDAVAGCLMMIRKDLFDKIGLMDEKYFLYFDDIDLSLRAKRLGYSQLYCPKARAYHNTSTPAKRFQSERWLHYAIYNGFYFMKSHYHGVEAAVFAAALSARAAYYSGNVILHNPPAKAAALLRVLLRAYFAGIRLALGAKA